jgi:photosystem II stability/assembly factor-like uncharacterized protein
VQGPFDDAVATSDAPRKTLSPNFPRPAGGKALTRLLTLLASKGYTELANAVIAGAATGALRESLLASVAKFPSSGGKRSQNNTAAGQAEHVGMEFIAAAQPPGGPPAGPPSPAAPQWESLGPYTIPNGQTYGSSRVSVSGRVSAIAVDPGNPNHVLCGGANGGVWESFNRGASWTPRTDYQATTTVGAITFDPSNPAIVYCGTGEGNWWSWLGVGVLQSDDGGASWSTLCTNPFVGQGFFDLKIHPSNRKHLLAATTGGLYTSTDGGQNWTQRRSVMTWSISVPPSGGATAEILAASSDGLWRSTNGGHTWTVVPLPGAPAFYNRLAVSIAPSNPSVAYAWGAAGSSAYLWRRSGGTWTAATLPSGGVSTGQAWYDWYVAAAPDIDTQVFCAAIDLYRADLSGGTWTWTDVSTKGGGGQSIHPDQHAIAFDPVDPNTIYAGCDGGLFLSPDRGITWLDLNDGLVITEFEYIGQNVGVSRWIIGGTQDNGTDRWTGSADFDHVADGDGGYVCVNHDDPLTVFHTYYDMSPEVSTTGGDFGSWTYIPPPVPSGESSPFYPPMRCSETNGGTMAIGGGALYITTNNGSTWTRLAFPGAEIASAICVPDANNVYVGTSDGNIYHSSYSSSAWSSLSALATPRAANVSDLLVDPANPKRIWVTYSTAGSGLVYRSDNGGANWTDCSAGLPNLSANAIEVDSRNPSRVWVAIDCGVYQSLDEGAHWASFSNGLPNAYIGDLLFHPHAWVLRAATRNRGLWQIPVDGWLTEPVCGVQWTGTLKPNQTARWFTFNWPATWHVVWTVMPTTPGTQAQLTWSVAVERASAEFVTYWITVQNLTAATVNFEGRFEILSRY